VQTIVESVDEDGSSKIEFGEFLQIIKGGSAAAKEGKESDNGTGAIHNFFKKLTSGELKGKNENMPFSLFISMMRRKRIIDSMMSKDIEKKKGGELILNNYKKQLAERMAREKVDRNELLDGGHHGGDSFMNKRIAEFESSDIPDPEVLRAILHKRGAVYK